MTNWNIVASRINNNTNEEFLENKKKKRWINGSGYYCFMVYPRALETFMDDGGGGNWDWKCFKETSDENIEVVKLMAVCWLEVKGRFKISDLSPGVDYEIAYEVKLTDAANGWELPLTLSLSLPDGQVKEHQLSLLGKPKGKWFVLNVGWFHVAQGEQGEVVFNLKQIAGHWKHGLIIRGVILRPKA